MSLLSPGDDDDYADDDDDYDDGNDDDAEDDGNNDEDDEVFDHLKHCQVRLTNSLNLQHQQSVLKGVHQITQIKQL